MEERVTSASDLIPIHICLNALNNFAQYKRDRRLKNGIVLKFLNVNRNIIYFSFQLSGILQWCSRRFASHNNNLAVNIFTGWTMECRLHRWGRRGEGLQAALSTPAHPHCVPCKNRSSPRPCLTVCLSARRLDLRESWAVARALSPLSLSPEMSKYSLSRYRKDRP